MADGSTGPTWPGPRPWVGRQEVLDTVSAAVAKGLGGAGRVVFLEGRPGSGRTALLHRVANASMQDGQAIGAAYGDAADPDTSAWEQIAGRLTRRDRMEKVVKRSAAGWVGLIPLVGGVLEAAIETGQALSGEPEVLDDAPTDSAIGQVRMLLSMGSDRPRLVLLDNIDAGDSEEFAGAFALIQRMKGLPMALLLTAAVDAGGRTRDLLLEVERLGIGSRVRLPPFSREEAFAALERAVGRPPPASWEAWWDAHLDGTPGGLWRTLGAAHAAGGVTQRLTGWAWAASPPDLGEEPGPSPAGPLPDVTPREAVLLRAGAAVGDRFTVGDLVAALGGGVGDMELELEPLIRRGIVSVSETIESEDELVDVLVFSDPPGRDGWRNI